MVGCNIALYHQAYYELFNKLMLISKIISLYLIFYILFCDKINKFFSNIWFYSSSILYLFYLLYHTIIIYLSYAKNESVAGYFIWEYINNIYYYKIIFTYYYYNIDNLESFNEELFTEEFNSIYCLFIILGIFSYNLIKYLLYIPLYNIFKFIKILILIPLYKFCKFICKFLYKSIIYIKNKITDLCNFKIICYCIFDNSKTNNTLSDIDIIINDLNNNFTSNLCTICLTDISKKDTIILECNHTFHKKCYETLIQHHKTCPNCRTVIKLKSTS